jgi:predicted nuclease of predicted toxin-antitoxin system
MKMRILANENFPREAVEALRDRGHDVAWVRTDSPGSSDDAVIERAAAEARVLITFDKDFGELAFRRGLSSPSGVILFRISQDSPSHVAQVSVTVLERPMNWQGKFSVVQEGGIRIVSLPILR